jgi:DNA-binding NarL/FixJ family response regulator
VSQPLRCSIRLFVAESNPIACQLLAEALARGSEIEVLGCSSIPSEIVKTVCSLCPDVLLISAWMDEEAKAGLAVLRQVRSERPDIKAVVLLDSSKPGIVVEAFCSGASGVFCRSTDIQTLRKCIAAVYKGQIWANSLELEFIIRALAEVQPLRLDGKQVDCLSTREKEVVRCLVVGLTNREIAQALAISQHTVKNYIFKIFEKLSVSNRVELASQVLGCRALSEPSREKLAWTAITQADSERTKAFESKDTAQLLEASTGARFLPKLGGVQASATVVAKPTGYVKIA